MSNNQNNDSEDEDRVFRLTIEESRKEAERANALSEEEQLRQAMQLSMQERDRIDARYQQHSDAAVQRLLRESAIEAEARQQLEYNDNLRRVVDLSIQDLEAHQAALDRQANEHFTRALKESYSDWNADQDRLEREVRARSARADARYQTIGVMTEGMFTDKEEKIWDPPTKMLSERQRQQRVAKGEGKASDTASASTARSKPPASTTATYAPSAVSGVSTGGLSTRATSSASVARPRPIESTSSGKYGPSSVSGVSTRSLPKRATSSASTARQRPPEPTPCGPLAPSAAPSGHRTVGGFIPLGEAMEELKRQRFAREAEEREAAGQAQPPVASLNRQSTRERPETCRQPSPPPIEYEDVSGEVAARLAEKACRRAGQTPPTQQAPSQNLTVLSQPANRNAARSTVEMSATIQAPAALQPESTHEAKPEEVNEEQSESQSPDDIRVQRLAASGQANAAPQPSAPVSPLSSTAPSATAHPPPSQRPSVARVSAPEKSKSCGEERRERMRRNASLDVDPTTAPPSYSTIPSRYVPPDPPAPPSAPVPTPPPSNTSSHIAMTTALPETVGQSEANCSITPNDSISMVLRPRAQEQEQEQDDDEQPRTPADLRTARMRALGVAGPPGNVHLLPTIIAEDNEEDGAALTWDFGDVQISTFRE